MAVPRYVNGDMINTCINAGINPNTGKSVQLDINCLPEEFRKQLRILDEQQAINRYVWYNLPPELDSKLLERILYYRGQGAFFWMDSDDGIGKFYFLPYTLADGIDCYGRWNKITPIPFNGTSKAEDGPWITGLTKTVIKEFPVDIDLNMYENGAVLLSDYSNQISQTNIPRQILQEPLLNLMSEIFPLVRTNLLANSGVRGMRVQSQDEQDNIQVANRTLAKAAISGEYFVPIVGTTEFQDLTSNSRNNTHDYFLSIEILNNYRMQLYGLSNNGLFNKSQYVNNTTAGNIQANAGLQYQDGLYYRQRFCDMINATWGLNVYCDTSEIIQNVDANMDGKINDTQDQSGKMAGAQPEGVIKDE